MPIPSYTASRAETYLSKRASSPKWKAEQKAVEEILSRFPAETRVLDAPVGTGRFLPFYGKRSFYPLGIDISPDMLSLAREVSYLNFVPALFRQEDIFQSSFEEETFDLVVCVRFLNWLSIDEIGKLLEKFSLISRKGIVISIRVSDGPTIKPNGLTIHRELSIKQIINSCKLVEKVYYGIDSDLRSSYSIRYLEKTNAIR